MDTPYAQETIKIEPIVTDHSLTREQQLKIESLVSGLYREYYTRNSDGVPRRSQLSTFFAYKKAKTDWDTMLALRSIGLHNHNLTEGRKMQRSSMASIVHKDVTNFETQLDRLNVNPSLINFLNRFRRN